MCGIAGYFGPRVPEQANLLRASDSIWHRGPDGNGAYTSQQYDCGIALIHRRLAIIDLKERSNQPFHYEHSVLVFNGEIYNYIELRRELEKLGHRFSTNGDTEVLAHALRQWGNAGLDKCEGMWALAWYDELDGSLLLSRDRFGEKPLMLWRIGSDLYFASEIKALAALAGRWPEVNRNHLTRYMVNGYKALYKTSDTFFLDIEELGAGCYLKKYPEGKCEIGRYWSWHPSIIETMTYGDAVDAIREALITAVNLRLRADVPLAFCMSGGVDSNSLISIARRVFNYNVHGFTILNTDPRYNEKELISNVVQELELTHTEIALECEGFLDNLRALVVQHDGPVSTISYYAHWQLMQVVSAHGYKVSISGTGADELFTGYYDHHNMYLYEVSDDAQHYSNSLAAWEKHQSQTVRNPYLRDPKLFINNPLFRRHIYLNNDEFSKCLKKPWREEFKEIDYGMGLLRNRMLNELFSEAVPVILREDDLNAMQFSIENRSPFLDRELFNTAYSIPTRHLIEDARAKAVLRDAMRGLVPDAILNNRTKVGFNVPIQDVLSFDDSKTIDCLMDNSPIFDYVRKQSIENLLKRTTLLNSESKFLFNVLNAKMFLEETASRAH